MAKTIAKTFAKDAAPEPCMLRFQLEEAAQGRTWPNDQKALDNIKSGKYKCIMNSTGGKL